MPYTVADAVTVHSIDDPDELHHQYPGEFEPQPCVLILNLRTGVLTASYKGEIGGTSAAVYHGHTIHIDIPCLTAKVANELLKQAKPYAERILAGSSIDWDGNNMVGGQDDDAIAALAELEALCDAENFETGDMVSGVDAWDYYSGISSSEAISQFDLTADTTDAELTEMARKAEADAAPDGEAGYTVLSGVEAYLTDLREDLRKAERVGLEQVAERIDEETDKFKETIGDLRADRNERIRRVHSWGTDSDRDIGDLAGISHTAVQKIAKVDQPA